MSDELLDSDLIDTELKLELASLSKNPLIDWYSESLPIVWLETEIILSQMDYSEAAEKLWLIKSEPPTHYLLLTPAMILENELLSISDIQDWTHQEK